MKSEHAKILPIVMLILLAVSLASCEQFPSEDSSWLSWLQSFFDSKSSEELKVDRKSSAVVPKRRLTPLSSKKSHAFKSPLDNAIDTELEYEEEIHDREVFKAVVTSLAEWNYKKMLREQSRHRRKRDEEVVCYGEILGCFRDEGPFDYLDMLPSHPDEIGTRFLLFTHKYREVPEVISYHNRSSILASSFNASHPTKIIVHGFGSSCYRLWAIEVRYALLSVGETNVICVEWENGAGLPNYVRAAVNTRLVGKQLAIMVNVLNDLTGTQNQDFHLIGYSLGAHVAGFAGAELKNLSRITGLDPAGPLFENYDTRVRLDASDANLVDVIHSNGESIIMGGLGAWGPMGHMDFYPNGGRMQKGCPNLFLGAVSDIILSTPEESGRSLCNHRRAYKFFTDSVVPGCHFPAFVCESYEKLMEGDCFPCLGGENCGNMGFFADKSVGRGVMYLATREEEPFCANQYRVVMYSSHSATPITSHGKIELMLIGGNDFNETFSLTKGPDVELHSSGKLVRLVVPHPVLSPPTKARLTYTAYHGWLTSGLPRWSFDKLILTDSFGNSFSFCQKGNILQSSVPVTVTLLPGDCNTYLSPNTNSWLSVDLTSTAENEIQEKIAPGFPQYRFSLDNYTASVNYSNPNNANTTRSSQFSWDSNAPAGGPTVGVYPYGNVPLSLIQQQLPADVKVASKRPSFYQWPFVSLFSGSTANSLKARAKSITSLGRKPDPVLQLTPPLPFPPTSHIQFDTPIANARLTARDEYLNSNRNGYTNGLAPLHPPRGRPGTATKLELDSNNANQHPNPNLNQSPNVVLGNNPNSNPSHSHNPNSSPSSTVTNLNPNINLNSNPNLSINPNSNAVPNLNPNLNPSSNPNPSSFLNPNSSPNLSPLHPGSNYSPNPHILPRNMGKSPSLGLSPQYPTQPRLVQQPFLQPSWTLNPSEPTAAVDSPVYYIYQLAPSLGNLNGPRNNPNYYNYFPATVTPSANNVWPAVQYTATKPEIPANVANLSLQPSGLQNLPVEPQQPQHLPLQLLSTSSRALGSNQRSAPLIYQAAAVVPLSRIGEDHVWNSAGNQTVTPSSVSGNSETPNFASEPSNSSVSEQSGEKTETSENRTVLNLVENQAETSGRSFAANNKPVTVLFKASDATSGPTGGLVGESSSLTNAPALSPQLSPPAMSWQSYPYQNSGFSNYQNYQLGPVYPTQVVNNERPWFSPNVWTQVVISNEDVKSRYIPLNPSDRQSRGLAHYRSQG